MSEQNAELKQGWQCCLLCGRTLTDRAAHDRLEQPVLAVIRAEHPEWVNESEACAPCVSHYRKLLHERMTRSSSSEEAHVENSVRRLPQWIGGLFARNARAQATQNTLTIRKS